MFPPGPEELVPGSGGGADELGDVGLEACLFPDGVSGSGQAGYLTYVAVQTYRQAMGNGLAQRAPSGPPPPSVLEIVQEAPPEEDSFAFRVRHSLRDVADLWLLVELTPATASLRRKPEEKNLAWFTENAPEAFLPLETDGTNYVLRGARYPVESGRRYGVRMRLVTMEGVAGPPVSGDFIKCEAQASPPEMQSRETAPQEGAAGDVPEGVLQECATETDHPPISSPFSLSGTPQPDRSGGGSGRRAALVFFKGTAEEVVIADNFESSDSRAYPETSGLWEVSGHIQSNPQGSIRRSGALGARLRGGACAEGPARSQCPGPRCTVL